MYNILISIIILILLLIYIKVFNIKKETFLNKNDIPVYISVTSIFKNQSELYLTLKSILSQSQQPNKIYVYLSEEPYILDDGFKNKQITYINLKNLLNDNKIFEIKFVENTGSYRKLLPLLKKKWDEECIIITIDDDTIYDENLIQNLVNDYKKYNCVINYRGFTPDMDKLEDFEHNRRSSIKSRSLYNFPLGKGGILYTPQFFKKTGNLIFNYEIYSNTCDKQDDIWFYIIRMLNGVDCYLNKNKKWVKKDISTDGLWKNFNKKNNSNTVAYHKTLKKIKQLYPQYF